MPAPSLDIVSVLTITTANLKTASTETYYLTNRAVGAGYYPILKSLSNFGSAMSGYMPQVVTGSAVIDNRPGSLGYERRFSDLFERETPINQLCEIAWRPYEVDGEPSPEAASKLASGYIRNWRVQGDDLVLTFESASVPRTIVTKAVNSIEHSTAPSDSLGQELPLVFGEDIQVKAVNTAESTTAPVYSYASFLGNEYVNGGVQTFYVKDRAGEYVQVLSASNPDTAVLTQTTGTNPIDIETTAESAGGVKGFHRERGWVLQQQFSVTPYVVTHIGVRSDIQGTSFDMATGTVKMQIFTMNPLTNLPDELLATSEVDAATIQDALDVSVGSTQEIVFAFAKPLILNKSSGYIVTLLHETEQVITADFTDYYEVRSVNSGSFYGIAKLHGRTNNEKLNNYYLTSTLRNLDYTLYAIKLTDTPGSSATVNASGLGHSYFSVTQKTGGACDLSELDYIVSIDGLKDVNGTVTGAAGTVITAPHHAIRVLGMGWSGSAWTGGDHASSFSTTQTQLTTSTSLTYRKISGRTEGRGFADQLMQEICRSSACRIAQVNALSGSRAVWAYGTTGAAVATLTDEDVTIESVESSTTQGVINYADIRYKREIKPTNLAAQAQTRDPSPYLGHFQPQNDAHFTAVTSLSQSLYGVRPLENANFNFINDDASAKFIADYYCRVFRHPSVLVTLNAPLYKYQDWYNSIDTLSIITIVHPKLPAYLGTSSNAKNPTYTGLEVDILPTGYLKRANAYRAQVESKLISFQGDNHPTMRLTCRLLINDYDLT